MKIIENIEENPQVRQKAINILLSWQPESSWWNRLSALTWLEPSPEMKVFISTTIHNAAKQKLVSTIRQ